MEQTGEDRPLHPAARAIGTVYLLYFLTAFFAAFLAEIALMLWLLVKGVKVARWEERAAGATMEV